jgi:hypothetical protein
MFTFNPLFTSFSQNAEGDPVMILGREMESLTPPSFRRAAFWSDTD